MKALNPAFLKHNYPSVIRNNPRANLATVKYENPLPERLLEVYHMLILTWPSNVRNYTTYQKPKLQNTE